MPNVTMYCTAVCPYCTMAEKLLNKKGVTEINKIRIDLDPSKKDEMVARTGRRTVPQIYIDDFHVGGFDDMSALDVEGKLEPLLAK
jgi:Glutaredoxin, GrxC family